MSGATLYPMDFVACSVPVVCPIGAIGLDASSSCRSVDELPHFSRRYRKNKLRFGL